ncbi:MAG: ABC-F family ATP-binding cassette domain-containing protein [Chloroflexi bacterium]|nr:MAG: ABC-F family ATP-binding cassette domain-containing protein [Chloroflexota bacterium]TMD82697.1 MAG: ABC-F family ATP-binding cassette domain-containing protein [Chloroflexota bacterium]
MPLLRIEKLTLMYGATEVLSELTFQVEPRQRLGIVGANGSGKSSLLRAISGELTPAAGTLTLAPRSRTAYLAQELEAGPHESVYADALHSRTDIMRLRERLAGLEASMTGATGADLANLVEEYGDVQHEYERLDGYAYDNRVAEVLFGVGLTEADQALPPSALSGGQRRRLALARLLLQDADLLLLDEPTNHLDLEAIEWLEGFLRLSRSGMLIVSHDRRFLERTADDILELQARAGEWYPGNYRQYLRLRRERRAVRQKEYDAQQDYIARTEEFIRRYKAGQRAREARGRQTKLDRLARVAPPANDEQIRIRLRASSTSDLIFQSDGLELVYPSPSGGSGWGLSMPAFTVSAGERVAIVGPNGSGKTSLLKALLGELRPREGRVKTGPRVTMRYYDQHLADLDPTKTVLTELQDAFGLPEETLRTFLGRLLFSGDDAFKTIRSLSGGEKSRVALAKLMLDDAGLLLLDEPTNHLDIPAQEMLEEALQDFEGTIVFVSHDRYFIDAIATRLWVIDDGAVTLHLGNYSDLERRRQHVQRAAVAVEPARSRRLDQRITIDGEASGSSVSAVEGRIEELEAEVRLIEEQLADHQTYDDPARVAELARAHEDASGRLRALYQEWEQAAGE